MSLKYAKIWGQTEPLLSNKAFELHRIEFREGHRCSLHRHNTKYNAFYVIDGVLQINVHKQNYDLVDETVLSPGDLTIVPPGEYHEFVAIKGGSALEIYWSEFDPDDIIRANTGE